MKKQIFKRIPKHIGIIPDGNRRWAVNVEEDLVDFCLFKPYIRIFMLSMICGQILKMNISIVPFHGINKLNQLQILMIVYFHQIFSKLGVVEIYKLHNTFKQTNQIFSF